MVHTDKIIKDLEFSYTGVFNFKEFLAMLKGIFKRYDYDLEEESYSLKTRAGLKTTKFKWIADNKIDDFNHVYIKLKISLVDYKEAYVDDAKVVDGKLNINIGAEVEKDYNKQWKSAPAKKFIRAVYEKYVTTPKQKNIESVVKKFVENLMNDLKQYFKIS